MAIGGEPRCPHCGSGIGVPATHPRDITPKRPHKCPICAGTGSVPHDFYTRLGVSTSTLPEKCRACGGRGVIVS